MVQSGQKMALLKKSVWYQKDNPVKRTVRMLLETHRVRFCCNSHCIVITVGLFSVVLSI